MDEIKKPEEEVRAAKAELTQTELVEEELSESDFEAIAGGVAQITIVNNLQHCTQKV